MTRPAYLGDNRTAKGRLGSYIPTGAVIRERLLDGSTFLLGGFMIASAVAQLYMMLMSRLLPTVDYGTLVALTSLSYFLAVLARTIQVWVIKVVAETKDAGSGQLYLIFDLVIRVLLPIGGTVLAVDWIARDWIAAFLHLDSVTPVVVLGLYAFAALVIPVPVGILLGLGRLRLASAVIVLESVFRLLAGTGLVYLGLGAGGAMFGYAAGSLMAFAVGLLPLLPVLVRGHRSAPATAEFGDFGSFTLLGFVINACLIFIGTIDQVVVKHYFSAEIAGNFAVAFLLGQIIAIATISFAWVVFARSAAMRADDPKRARLLVNSLLATGAFAVVMTLGYLIAPNLAVLVMGGSRYSSASGYLGPEGIEMTLFALTYVQAYYLMSVKQMRVAWILFAAVVSEVVLAGLYHQTVQQYLLTHIFVLAGLLACVSVISLRHFRSENALSPVGMLDRSIYSQIDEVI